jgi:hypothetical protein
MNAVKEPLAAALADLEHAFGEDVRGREQEWAAQVDRALVRLEKGVRQHDANLESEEGGVVDVQSAQVPSPTMDRRLARLHADLADLLREARRLHRLGAEARPDTPAFDAFRARAAQLLQALERYEEKEARVILESTTLDLGAGD